MCAETHQLPEKQIAAPAYKATIEKRSRRMRLTKILPVQVSLYLAVLLGHAGTDANFRYPARSGSASISDAMTADYSQISELARFSSASEASNELRARPQTRVRAV